MKDYNGNSLTPNDFSYASLYEGTYSIWNGKGSIVTETEGVRLSNSYIYIYKNLTGSSTTSAPAVGDTVSSLKNYIKVAAPSSSENSVTLDGYCYVNSSTSVSEVLFWMVITDREGKVLSVKPLENKSGTYSCLESGPFTFDLNIKAKSDIYIGIMYDENTLSRGYFSISSVFIGKNVEISFNKNSDDATISTTSKGVIVGEKSSLPSASKLGLRREGCAFAGWAESADATEVKYADGAEIFVTEATTLYAVWTKENARLSFDKNSDDATIGTKSKNVKVSEEVQLPIASDLGLIRDGYAFAGWAESADATEAKYADGAKISVADDTTLYAVWKKYVAITFYKDKDVKIEAASKSAAPGSTVLLPEAKWLKLSRPDYVFAGWAKSADATEAEYADGAEISVTEDTTLYAVWKGAVFFTEFTATGLRKEYAPDTTTEEVKVSGSYYSYDAKDGSWSVDSSVQVKSFTGKTFDYEAGTGYSYTDRFCFNSKNEERGIKLRIGVGKTKILRIDGGSDVELKNLDADNKGIIDISIKGAETKTWSPKVRYSTYYVEVTGDEDGYVSITTRDTTDKSGQIYGIYVVDSLVDISSEKQVYTSVSYDSPSLSLNKTADLNGQDSVALTVNVNSTPKRTTTTKTISVDGLGDVSSDIVEEELSDLQWSYQWYKSGNKIKGATSETYSASDLATYSVKVSYKYTDENGKTQSKSTTKECVVTDSKASDVVVTFKKNSKNASIASENYQTVKSGATVALTKSKDLNLSNAGYAFMGWATSADGKVSYVDGANILFYENTTLYAVWVAKSSGELVGYPNANGEWTQAENKLLADVTDSAGNTILEFAAMNNLVGNSYGSKGEDIDGDSVDYFKYMKTDSGTSNSRYIKITVPEGKTADVFCAFWSGSNGSIRSVGIGTKSANNSFDVVAKVSTSSRGSLSYLSNDFALPAGTYYVNVDGNIEFSAIQVRLYSEE